MTREPKTVQCADRTDAMRMYAAGELQIGDTVIIGANSFLLEDSERASPPPEASKCDFCDRPILETTVIIEGQKEGFPPARICEHCITDSADLLARTRAAKRTEREPTAINATSMAALRRLVETGVAQPGDTAYVAGVCLGIIRDAPQLFDPPASPTNAGGPDEGEGSG